MSQLPATGGSNRKRQSRPSLSKALKLMEDALRVLDELGAAPEIGAHLDLAIQRLREAMRRTRD